MSISFTTFICVEKQKLREKWAFDETNMMSGDEQILTRWMNLREILVPKRIQKPSDSSRAWISNQHYVKKSLLPLVREIERDRWNFEICSSPRASDGSRSFFCQTSEGFLLRPAALDSIFECQAVSVLPLSLTLRGREAGDRKGDGEGIDPLRTRVSFSIHLGRLATLHKWFKTFINRDQSWGGLIPSEAKDFKKRARRFPSQSFPSPSCISKKMTNQISSAQDFNWLFSILHLVCGGLLMMMAWPFLNFLIQWTKFRCSPQFTQMKLLPRASKTASKDIRENVPVESEIRWLRENDSSEWPPGGRRIDWTNDRRTDQHL